MSRRIVVFGAGGHGKVVADAATRAGLEVIAFVDDDPRRGPLLLGVPVRAAAWLESEAPADVAVALGVGDNRARADVARRCAAGKRDLATVIHPSAVIAPSAAIGAGVVACAFAVVNAHAKVGAGTILNTSSVVEHDVVVGEFAHVSPGGMIAGGGGIGSFAHLGLGAMVLDDVIVGSSTIVGAGAVVNRNLPADVVAYGVPARVRRSRT